MAPTKEKAKKNTNEEGSAMVLAYLRQQNRPYSATDISANLHNKISKTHAAKFLKELHDRKEVEGRAAGKQLVYHCLQAPPSDDESPADLAALEGQATALRERVTEAKATEKTLKSELTLLSAATSPEDLKSTIEALLSQKAGLEDRLVELKKVKVTPVSEGEKTQLESEKARWSKLRNQRKAILRNLWQQFVDIKINASEDRIKEKDLWEELGCDGEMPK